MRAFTPLGATGVGVFLVCSGYGLEKSNAKNGKKHYWYKRVVNVWLPYAIIEGIALPLHYPEGGLAIIKDFLLIEPLHPFGWYMRFLFVWYALYYVASFAEKNKTALLLLYAFCLWAFCDALHAQNSFSFAIGVALARQNHVRQLTKMHHLILLTLCSGLLFFLRDYVKNNGHDIRLLWNGISLLYYTALTMATIVAYKTFTAKGITFLAKGLTVIGIYSYELYLVHGYAYGILGTPANLPTITAFAAVCIVASLLLHKTDHFTIRSINKHFIQ